MLSSGWQRIYTSRVKGYTDAVCTVHCEPDSACVYLVAGEGGQPPLEVAGLLEPI